MHVCGCGHHFPGPAVQCQLIAVWAARLLPSMSAAVFGGVLVQPRETRQEEQQARAKSKAEKILSHLCNAALAELEDYIDVWGQRGTR